MSHRALLFGGDGRRPLARQRARRRRRRRPHPHRARRSSASTSSTTTSAGAVVDRRPRCRRVRPSPAASLDCGNSGTSIRLLTGLLAGRPFLSCSPATSRWSSGPWPASSNRCGRWARTSTGATGAPSRRSSSAAATSSGCVHHLGVASAQVKTALLLAGLQASGTTEVVEPAASRDHTERMLAALGAPLDPGRRARGARHRRGAVAVRVHGAGRSVVGRVLGGRRHHHARVRSW